MNSLSEKQPFVGTGSDDLGQYEAAPAQRDTVRRRFGVVYWVGIALLTVPLALLTLGSTVLVYNCEHPLSNSSLLSNGTHQFKPTLILVSLDGFRPDYLDRGITPNLLEIGKQGLRADYMLPSFPSSTFPNHYTIVTGLYPGSHGIVSNEFYDNAINDTFVYKNAKKNVDPRWWNGGEPIWVTAEKQGVKAGIDMWPGSTAVIRGVKPSYVIPYMDRVHPTAKTQQLLEWLDLPIEKRPAFLATYMPEVDQAAHNNGPDAKPVNDAVQMVDEALGELHREIARRNLTHIVNLMVVSDHGMATTYARKYAIYVDDYIDVSRLHGIYGWPLGGIQPKDDADVPEMFRRLSLASQGQPWRVYLRRQIPRRFHYTHETRVAPIYIIPELPWYVSTRAADQYHASQIKSSEMFPPTGVHGYDNLHPLMRATFVATGPAFRSRHTQARSAPMTMLSTNITVLDRNERRLQYMAARRSMSAVYDLDLSQLPGSSPLAPQRFGMDNRISDMSATEDFLELLESARESQLNHINSQLQKWNTEYTAYQAEYDRIWGDYGLPEHELAAIRHPPFENVELYGLMARILHVNAAPNNGTSKFADWWLA